MDITTLKSELVAKNEVRLKAYDALVAHIKNVLEANIDREVTEVSRATDSMAEIKIKDDTHHRSFEIYYHKRFGNESRKLELNFGCFGSFSSDDVYAVHYCEVLGHIAGILNFLEEYLLKSPKAKALFDAYDNASSEVWNAQHALEDAKNAVKTAEQKIKDIDKMEVDLTKVPKGGRLPIAANYLDKYQKPWSIIHHIEHIFLS